MSDTSPRTAPAALRSQPTLWRAWSGIWLFTWRSQLTWGRIRILSVLLLVLPFLVWVTTHSAASWARRDRYGLPLGDINGQMFRLNGRMNREKTPLETNQMEQIRLIFTREYNLAQKAFREIPSPETSIDQQRNLVQNSHERITDAVKPVLNTRQFNQFSALDKEIEARSEDQIGGVIWNRAAPFYFWLVYVYSFLILPFSCVWACGGLIRDELQTDTLSFLTTRPIKRASLVLLKYLAQVAWLEIVVLVEALLLFETGALRDIQDLHLLIPLFLGVQFLAVPAWSALGLFLGQVTKYYLPLALVYGLVVEWGIGEIPTNINTVSLLRHIKVLLSHNHDLQSVYEWSGTGVFVPIGALLLACALFVGLSAFLFTFREYHANTEMQK